MAELCGALATEATESGKEGFHVTFDLRPTIYDLRRSTYDFRLLTFDKTVADRPCLRLAPLHGSLWPMNVISQGIDLVECSRIAAILDRHQTRFLFRVLTAKEREAASRFADAIPHISGRFAAKEAVLKALGTGWRGQISWKDIEVTNNSLGKPDVQLSGECSRIAQKLGVTRILLSITHTRTHAVASAIALDDKN